MLVDLIAFGAFDTGVLPGMGTVNAPADAIVAITKTIATGGTGTGIPIGAFQWSRPLDPSDRALFAFDWSSFLESGETIASVEQVTMSALGASLGVQIDASTGRVPIIDAANKKVGLWFLVDPSFQANAAFADAGTRVAIAMRIRTDADPYREYERSAVLVVRQQ